MPIDNNMDNAHNLLSFKVAYIIIDKPRGFLFERKKSLILYCSFFNLVKHIFQFFSVLPLVCFMENKVINRRNFQQYAM